MASFQLAQLHSEREPTIVTYGFLSNLSSLPPLHPTHPPHLRTIILA